MFHKVEDIRIYNKNLRTEAQLYQGTNVWIPLYDNAIGSKRNTIQQVRTFSCFFFFFSLLVFHVAYSSYERINSDDDF